MVRTICEAGRELGHGVFLVGCRAFRNPTLEPAQFCAVGCVMLMAVQVWDGHAFDDRHAGGEFRKPARCWRCDGVDLRSQPVLRSCWNSFSSLRGDPLPVIALFGVVASFSALCVLPPPSSPIAYPPYCRQTCSGRPVDEESELMMSDIPWAVGR